MTKKIEFTDIQKSDISDKYLIKKKNIKEIALEYSVSDTPIKGVLRKLGVISRLPTDTIRKYYLDETYFDNIDSADKAYFLGLMFADGYNCEKNGSFTLVLIKKDKHILEKFSQHLKTNKPIKDSESELHNDTSNMTIYSKKISQRLAQLGCMQGKSFKNK